MILQGFNSGMLTNRYLNFSLLNTFNTISLILLCTGYSTCTFAEAKELYRKEPISPIPQTVTFDEDRAMLGESLFFDTRLSKDNTVACATCHQLDDGGGDNVAKGVSLTSDEHVINTPSVFNAQYNFRQNWDGSAKSLHQQIDMAVTNRHEFNSNWDNIITRLTEDDQIKSDFNKSYSDGITRDNITDAIVEFEKTLITPNSRFDRYLRNEDMALTKEEIEGYRLFKDLGCISCHQGKNIGGNLFQKFGVFYDYIADRGNITKQDYGKFNTSNRQTDKFVFKVPSLRNVAVTAPYLHDGSATTIEDAIAIMGKTQLGKTLTESEILSIKTFLNTLTGEYKNKLLDVKS